LVCASVENAVTFAFSAGNIYDAPAGNELLKTIQGKDGPFVMDKAYEGEKPEKLRETKDLSQLFRQRQTAKILGTWNYDKALYRRRNEIERHNLRIQRFRRIFTRFEKLDLLFAASFILPWSLTLLWEHTLIIDPCRQLKAIFVYFL
jgi:transposase